MVLRWSFVALSLFAEDDYEEVAMKVTGALTRFGCWDARWQVPSSSGDHAGPGAVGCAGDRRDLRVGGAAGRPGRYAGAWLRGWRILAIDGFDADMPDTPGNAAEFGYAGSGEETRETLRWEQETGHDQLKTHLRGPGRPLRSRLPELVRQEIWAWLIVHYALAVLITQAAEAAHADRPERLPHAYTLQAVRNPV
jgi:hypothetical protein